MSPPSPLKPPPAINGSPTIAPQNAPEDISVKVEEEERIERRPFILEGRLGVGASIHGGPNGTLLAIDSIGNFGDFVDYEASGSMLFNLTEGKLKLRAGPQLRVAANIGDENSGGSSLYSIGAGPKAELDWRAFWGRGFFAGPSRFSLDFNAAYGFGNTTADTYSLHEQDGVELSVGAALNLVNVSFGGMEVGLDMFARTSSIYGDDFNTPFNSFGGALVFRSAEDKTKIYKRIEMCPANDQVDYAEKIQDFQAKNKLLREENAEQAQLVAAIKERLTSRKITREQMVEELRSGYEDYLANRSENPIADPKVRATMAQERFPDDFDPFLWQEVAPREIPDPLPTDCDELREIERRLRDENADLREQKGLLLGLARMGFIRLGVPEAVAAQYTSAIARLRDVNFRTNTPFGQKVDEGKKKDEPGYNQEADIKTIEASATAWAAAHPIDPATGLREAATQEEMEKVFGPLFPPGEDRTGKMRFQSVEILLDLSHALRDPAMKNMLIFLVGHTSSPGSDAHNMALSLRRVRALRAFMIMQGIPENRLFYDGRGETELIYKRDVLGGDKTNGMKAEYKNLARYGIKTNTQRKEEAMRRQAVNRRMEFFVSLPDSTDPAIQALIADPEIQAQMQAAGVIKPAPGGGAPPTGDVDTDDSSAGGGEASPSVTDGTGK